MGTEVKAVIWLYFGMGVFAFTSWCFVPFSIISISNSLKSVSKELEELNKTMAKTSVAIKDMSKSLGTQDK